nr:MULTISPECIES: phospholipase D family protein [unclassified Streptomyces]
MKHASNSVILIAPFIKKPIFEAAVDAIPASVETIRCVTRWTPAEVAAGVSDPEIMEVAERDKRVRVMLCPTLHAKIYAADDYCLIGSANLTGKATGRVPGANIELLIKVATAHPEVQRVLGHVESIARSASLELAAIVRRQANLLEETGAASSVPDVESKAAALWYPNTRRPENLYALYNGRGSFAAAVEAGIIEDLALLDIPAGLDESDFHAAVRSRLGEIPELQRLQAGHNLSSTELQKAIAERSGASEGLARRRTENIAAWLQYFDRYYTEVDTWALRPGRELT